MNSDKLQKFRNVFGRPVDVLIHRFKLSYNDKYHHLSSTGIPINPQSWCHQCTKIDTRSGNFFHVKVLNVYDFKGNIIVIVNGKVLLEEVILFFKNSYNIRPNSLQGNL